MKFLKKATGFLLAICLLGQARIEAQPDESVKRVTFSAQAFSLRAVWAQKSVGGLRYALQNLIIGANGFVFGMGGGFFWITTRKIPKSVDHEFQDWEIVERAGIVVRRGFHDRFFKLFEHTGKLINEVEYILGERPANDFWESLKPLDKLAREYYDHAKSDSLLPQHVHEISRIIRNSILLIQNLKGTTMNPTENFETLIKEILAQLNSRLGMLSPHEVTFPVIPMDSFVSADLLSRWFPQMTIRYRSEVADDLEIRGDQLALSNVIYELIRNAEKYAMPPIDVDVAIENDELVIRISDQGPGIPAEFLEEDSRIGAPKMFRLNVTSSRVRTGENNTGKGLADVFWTIHDHGGSISIDTLTKEEVGALSGEKGDGSRRSAPGTTFTLTLPIADRAHLTSADRETLVAS